MCVLKNLGHRFWRENLLSGLDIHKAASKHKEMEMNDRCADAVRRNCYRHESFLSLSVLPCSIKPCAVCSLYSFMGTECIYSEVQVTRVTGWRSLIPKLMRKGRGKERKEEVSKSSYIYYNPVLRTTELEPSPALPVKSAWQSYRSSQHVMVVRT